MNVYQAARSSDSVEWKEMLSLKVANSFISRYSLTAHEKQDPQQNSYRSKIAPGDLFLEPELLKMILFCLWIEY